MKRAHQNTKSIEGEIALPQDQLMALFYISQRMNRITDLQQLLNEILHSAIANIGAERGLLILVDDAGESYQTVASQSLQKKEDIAFSKSIVKATLEKKETLLSAELKSDARFKNAESIRTLRIFSFVCVPLIVTGRGCMLGTLYVDQRIHKKSFTREDAAFLEAFANLAAIAISNASLMDKLRDENVQLRQELEKIYEFSGVISESKAMHKIFREMKQILNDDCTVLITGESGTGKEVIAKAIHYNGNRKDKPFLAINCGALPETLLEAELFGSVRGAFTGAVDKQGLFQAAHGGTLFLDEIHHTSEAMQIKLLRVLQEKEIRRVGGTKNIKVDARLICATNEDLQEAIQEGRFRQDLYYRINVVTLNVPPLRKRREDIPVLAQHFLNKYAKAKKKQIKGFEKKAMETLTHYDWAENNVRELENEIERLAIFTKDGNTIKFNNLSEKIRKDVAVQTTDANLAVTVKGKTVRFKDFEKKYINYVLRESGGNIAKAARLMGMTRSTLRGKLRKLGLGK